MRGKAGTFGGRLAAIGLAAVICGCGGTLESPRKPYLPPPATAAVREQPSGGDEPPAFRALEGWSWARALDPPERFPTARGPLQERMLGLYPAHRFRLARGDCADCGPAGALPRLGEDVVAVPDPAAMPNAASAGAGTGDVPREASLPPLVWMGAPQLIEHATLAPDGRALTLGGATIPLFVTPKSPTNAAWVDASTVRFFAHRPIRVRGATHAEGDTTVFVARTLWPEDARLATDGLPLEPLGRGETLGTLIEAQASAEGAFAVRLLFERAPGARHLAGKPVLAFVLSGAQGDDDGSLAGHLAVATGILGPRGEWADWIVNNFYPLREPNAKGITPAPVPMDNYLLDLNSGQLYYRPAYLLVAVLARPRAAQAVQTGLQDTMRRLYCGEMEFDLATMNSTALSIDPLRELGWRIPRTGPTSRMAGVIAAPLAAIARRRFATARDAFAMFTEEKTRLLPRVAFEVAGHDLLYLVGRGNAGAAEDLTPFERHLVEDVDAILFARLPQVPSSRRFGTHPIRSLLAYGAELLADPRHFERAPEAGTADGPAVPAEACAR
ncbi:MAG TPA: hypothetical protein VF322_12665 [Gammaproteobacteria bacterium]